MVDVICWESLSDFFPSKIFLINILYVLFFNIFLWSLPPPPPSKAYYVSNEHFLWTFLFCFVAVTLAGETFHSMNSELRELPPIELSTLPLILKVVIGALALLCLVYFHDLMLFSIFPLKSLILWHWNLSAVV